MPETLLHKDPPRLARAVPPKRLLRELEAKLNEERGLSTHLRRPRGVKLSEGEIIQMMQNKVHLPALSETVDGRRYARTCDWGNPASEALVRTNYRQFVVEVRKAVKDALANHKPEFILDLCGDYEDGIRTHGSDAAGMRMAAFFTKSGWPLARNRAFFEAIKQFFKDEHLVLKIMRVALEDRKAELKKQEK